MIHEIHLINCLALGFDRTKQLRLISMQAERLIAVGLQVTAPGVNVPFDDPNIFFGNICEFVGQKVSLTPDFMANCGMSRTFSYLMQDGAKLYQN